MAGKSADTNLHAGEVDPTLVANATANRMAAQFFEKYERFEVQEMLAQTSYHWFLSQVNKTHLTSCCGSVDKTTDSWLWGPWFKSADSGSSALGQGILSSLPSPSERT